MIVDVCSAFQKQRNIESNHFFLELVETVCSFHDFDKFGSKVTEQHTMEALFLFVVINNLNISHS